MSASIEQHLRVVRAAADFLTSPLGEGMIERFRDGNGDLVRYDMESGAYGVLSNQGVIRTFFVPIVEEFKPWNIDALDYFIQSSQ